MACIRTWYDARDTTAPGKVGPPMVTEGVFTPAYVLAEVIRRGEVSSVEVVEAYLAQIARHNPDLNAVVTLDEDGAIYRPLVWLRHGTPMKAKQEDQPTI